MDAERWQRLSPLLDAMLELDPQARADSLAGLRADDPRLADELETLLALEHGQEDFLAEPMVPPLPGPRPDAVVGPYKLERMLGEGGMGQVWLARRDDGLYQRRVALKLLRPGLADPNLRLRFTRERQILARLEHPHIARLLDAGISADNQPYLALEYVEGEPITDWCRARGLDVEARIRLFLQVCDAASHAHANLIVHRDLKPSNILVTALEEVRLLDFGIAKLLDTPEHAPDHTGTGLRAFTLHYAAPEQVRGEPVTTMTDVYSLGVVLYELLTDGKPYRLKRQTDAEWEEAILVADPMRPSLSLQRTADTDAMRAPGLRRRARELAGDLDNIVLKTLGKRPEQRYPSVEALSLDLRRHLDGKPVLARPQSLAYRMRKYVRRHRWALATAALVTGVLTTALVLVAWQVRQAVQEASRAQALQDFVVDLFENAGTTPEGAPLDVRQLLDAGVQRGNRELARQPVARAELLGVIARARLGLGDTAQALALLNRQKTIVDAVGDVPSSLRLQMATDLGRTQRLLARSGDCIASMRPVLALARREEQQLPLQAAEFHSQLGRCHRARNQPNAARQLFQRALALRRDLLRDDAAVVETLADLAGLRADAGEVMPALQAYSAALVQLRNTVGPRHPLAIELNRNIAMLQRQRNDLVAAEAAYRDALQLSEELRGMRHPETLALRWQLAGMQFGRGRYADVQVQFDAIHAALIERYGARHPLVAQSLQARGRLALERDDPASALAALRQAVAIRRLTPDKRALPDALSDYAAALHAAGRDAAALRALQEARRLHVARGELAQAGESERRIGDLLTAMDRLDAAAPYLDRAATLTRNGYGTDDPRTRRAELSQARLWLRQGRDDLALPRLAALIEWRGDAPEARDLRWRARAAAAESRCSGSTGRLAQGELDALIAEIRLAFPEGGVLAREVARTRLACARG